MNLIVMLACSGEPSDTSQADSNDTAETIADSGNDSTVEIPDETYGQTPATSLPAPEFSATWEGPSQLAATTDMATPLIAELLDEAGAVAAALLAQRSAAPPEASSTSAVLRPCRACVRRLARTSRRPAARGCYRHQYGWPRRFPEHRRCGLH